MSKHPITILVAFLFVAYLLAAAYTVLERIAVRARQRKADAERESSYDD